MPQSGQMGLPVWPAHKERSELQGFNRRAVMAPRSSGVRSADAHSVILMTEASSETIVSAPLARVVAPQARELLESASFRHLHDLVARL